MVLLRPFCVTQQMNQRPEPGGAFRKVSERYWAEARLLGWPLAISGGDMVMARKLDNSSVPSLIIAAFERSAALRASCSINY